MIHYFIPRHGAGPVTVLRSRTMAQAAWCEANVAQLRHLLEFMELQRIYDKIDAGGKAALCKAAEQAPEIQRRAKLPRPPRSTRPTGATVCHKRQPARVARSNC